MASVIAGIDAGKRFVSSNDHGWAPCRKPATELTDGNLAIGKDVADYDDVQTFLQKTPLPLTLFSRQILQAIAGLTKLLQWALGDLANPLQWPLWRRLRLLLLSALVRYAISQNPRRCSYHYLVWLPLLALHWAVDGFDGERTAYWARLATA